ncbi:MAG: hypothetical protein C0498_01280 [Anaerolinea sp.]|nr:hypothetical protein [Anaerolinea sp.]
MAEYALVRGGRVVNVIVADAAFAASIGAEFDGVVRVDVLPVRPGPGWGYDGAAFAPPAAPAPVADRLAAARAKWAAAPALVKNEAMQALAIALGLQDQ